MPADTFYHNRCKRGAMTINGEPVVDAKRPVTLHVTPKDVANGQTKDPSCCAAARAALRQTHCKEVRVHLGRTYLKIGQKWFRFQTPKSLRTEIISFDRAKVFAPGSYVLSPLSRSKQAKKSGTETSRTRPKHLQKKRAPYHHVTGVRAAPHG